MRFNTLPSTKQQPEFIDLRDYPNVENVYLCKYTKKLVKGSEAIWRGAIHPQVRFTYAHSPGFEPHRKQEQSEFNDMDANCNTCKHFKRKFVDKCMSPAAFIYGDCDNKEISYKDFPYKPYDNKHRTLIMLHPADYMGMACYENRDR